MPCTAAVVAVDTASDPTLSVLSSLWDGLSALAPDRIIVLGDVGVNAAGQFVTAAGSAGFGPSASMVPVVVFPGGPPAVPRRHFRLVCGGWIVLGLSIAGLESDLSGELAWLSDALAGVSSESGLVILLDRPPWDRLSAAWLEVEAMLSALSCRVQVVVGGCERFSWWAQDSLEFICVGAAPDSDVRGALSDGRFAGAVWARLGPRGCDFRVLRPAGFRRPEVFARDLQRERLALRAAWSATPVAVTSPWTEISGTNPARRTVSFRAEWVFSRPGSRVEPEMLSVSLEPGQTFRQRFRLFAPEGRRLKFAQPRLVLRGALPDGLGGDVPVVVQVSPHIRMGGEMSRLEPHGDSEGSWPEWSDGGHPLGHPSQLVPPRTADDPEGDGMDGVVYVGMSGSDLVVTVDLAAVPDTRCEASLYVDPRAGEGRLFAPGESPLTISCDQTGVISQEGGDPGAVRTAWSSTEKGMRFTVTVPASQFELGLLPETVLLDVLVRRFDASGRPLRPVCFSGDGQCLHDSGLYATFSRPGRVSAEAGR